MQKLCSAQALDPPKTTEYGLDFESTLALTLMRGLRPETTHDEAAAALCQRVVEVTRLADDVVMVDIPVEMIDECCTPGDKTDMRQHRQKVAKDKARRNAISAAVQRGLKEAFEAKKPKAPKKDDKKPLDKLATKEGAQRWWSSIKGDGDWIRTWMPPGSNLFVDDANGRFRFGYKLEGPKSVSWYRRGLEAASTEVLRVLWGWHFRQTGEQCPIPL